MSTVNLNCLDSCRAAWINYNYENNTQNITAEDIAKIKDMYGSQLKSWKPEATVDQNDYDIEDDPVERKSSSKTSLAITSGTVVAGAVAINVTNLDVEVDVVETSSEDLSAVTEIEVSDAPEVETDATISNEEGTSEAVLKKEKEAL